MPTRTPQTSTCQDFSIVVPPGNLDPGDDLALTANYKGSEVGTYSWQISSGKIVTGAATPVIRVDTSELIKGAMIRVKVKFAGTHLKCTSTATVKVRPEFRPNSSSFSNLSGRVLDRNGRPIQGATVSLDPATADPTVTDASGRYTFREIPAYEYQLNVTSGGKQKIVAIRAKVNAETRIPAIKLP